MARYELPDLRYDYGALEPFISGHILELHHSKHHRAYVNGANSALEKLANARRGVDLTATGAIANELAFHASGHVLHSIYWQNLAPAAGGEPSGALLLAIERDFESFAMFKKQLIHCAATIMGSGWAALVYDPFLSGLAIVQIHDHQSLTIQGSVPLLVLDVWEHAYYLQYETDKGSYLENIFQLWNWDDVATRLAGARALDGAKPKTPRREREHRAQP